MKTKSLILIGSVTFFLLTSWGMIALAIWLTPHEKPEAITEKIEKSTIQKQIDPIAQMQKRLGSKWEKIEMVQGKWYGPYPLREGSGWRIAPQGKIWVKEGLAEQYLDSSDIYRCEPAMGESVVFSSYTPKAILFFKH